MPKSTHQNPPGFPDWPLVKQNSDGSMTVEGNAADPDYFIKREDKFFVALCVIVGVLAIIIGLSTVVRTATEERIALDVNQNGIESVPGWGETIIIAVVVAVVSAIVLAIVTFLTVMLPYVFLRRMFRIHSRPQRAVIHFTAREIRGETWRQPNLVKDLTLVPECSFRVISHPTAALVHRDPRHKMSRALYQVAATVELLYDGNGIPLLSTIETRPAQDFATCCNMVLRLLAKRRTEASTAVHQRVD